MLFHSSEKVGECPIVMLTPAISGAIFIATEQRSRSLPLLPNRLKV